MQARRTLSLAISLLILLAITISVPLVAQEATASVPHLITFSGTLGPAATAASENGVVMTPGATPTKVVSVTFSLYSGETGGAPLWSEVQNVHVDGAGHYTVELGASKPDGLPMDIFSSVQAHWLGVQPQGAEEQPRVLLVSVPYALKSADAETFGGLPPSAYQLVPTAEGNQTTASATGSATISGAGNTATDSKKPGFGSPGYLPMYTTFTTLGNSVIYQQLATGKIGIGTMMPKGKFDVVDNNADKGAGVVHGSTNIGNALGVSGENFDTVLGIGVGGHAVGLGGIGVFGVHDNTLGSGPGVSGLTYSSSGTGILGTAASLTGASYGVSGASASVDGVGVIGVVTAAGGGEHAARGVQGQAQDPNGAGGFFANTATSGPAFGVSGISSSPNGKGVIGIGEDSSVLGAKLAAATTMGVWGDSGTGFGMLATADDSIAIFAANNSTTAPTINAANDATTGPGYALSGLIFSTDQNASAVYGEARPATGATNGVWGKTNSTDVNADGVFGLATANTGGANGVQGISYAPTGYGVLGQNKSGSTGGHGVVGTSTGGTGVLGIAGYGSIDCCTNAIFGSNVATSGHNNGGELTTSSPGGVGGILENTGGGLSILARVNANQNSFAVDGSGNGWFNGFLTVQGAGTSTFTGNLTVQGGGSNIAGTANINGDLNVHGNLNKLSGSFKIDDPLDPANKYLSHSFVESPDMMNIYNGVVRLDAHGEAWVVLPEYFEALNRDFRYQLTSMGSSQPRLYIAREVSGNRFKISGGRANGKVSWQVTGVRHDAWANAHRIPNEEEKPKEARGKYLFPDPYVGKTDSNGTAIASSQH